MDELFRNSMLSVLEGFTLTNPDNVARDIADDFRARRIEKNITREMMAERSGVALSNIVRFEQKGLISLANLIMLAMALGYTSEVRHIFSEPKYSTIDELQQIKKNRGKKKASKIRKNNEKD